MTPRTAAFKSVALGNNSFTCQLAKASFTEFRSGLISKIRSKPEILKTSETFSERPHKNIFLLVFLQLFAVFKKTRSPAELMYSSPARSKIRELVLSFCVKGLTFSSRDSELNASSLPFKLMISVPVIELSFRWIPFLFLMLDVACNYSIKLFLFSSPLFPL